MASIDLNDLIPALIAQTSAPGEELYTGVAAGDWLTYMLNGFWGAKLAGLLGEYKADEEGLVSPVAAGGPTIPRDQQQIVVIFAAMDIVRNQLMALNTMEKNKTGPVEYEYQKSATLLKAILDSLTQQKAIILERLADTGSVPSYYIDGIISRDQSINNGYTHWIGY